MTIKINKCPKCMGWGWWPIGDLSPIGPMDAQEWVGKTITCPWCNMGHVKGERYQALKSYKEQEEKENAKKKTN